MNRENVGLSFVKICRGAGCGSRASLNVHRAVAYIHRASNEKSSANTDLLITKYTSLRDFVKRSWRKASLKDLSSHRLLYPPPASPSDIVIRRHNTTLHHKKSSIA